MSTWDQTPLVGRIELGRRRFLAVALVLAAGGLASGLRADAGAASASVLLTVLADPAAAARFGRAYLDAHPEEANVGGLVDRLVASVSARKGGMPDEPHRLTAAVVGLVQEEYATGALLRTDGWLLAPSEARLYALAALANGPAAVR